MKNQTSRIHDRTFKRGFTIIECLVSLAITAILMVSLGVAFNASAMNYKENEQMFRTINGARQALTRITAILMVSLGVAFNASAMNYKENEQMFRTINGARQALTRITAQLRTGHFVDPNAPTYQCRFYTDANDNLTYEYRSADQKLYLITNSDGHEYTLCDNVTSANFLKTPDGHGDCKSVQISLTVQNSGRQRTLAAAAVIRRNLAL